MKTKLTAVKNIQINTKKNVTKLFLRLMYFPWTPKIKNVHK